VSSDHRVTALRRNYENVRCADHTNDPVPLKAGSWRENEIPAKTMARNTTYPEPAKSVEQTTLINTQE
jgi:hypothetical protein